jgi:hypothetical protein
LPYTVFIQANKKQIEFLRNKVQKMNEKTVTTKATMTMVTTNGDGAISVEAIALIDAIFEAVTRSESWNGAHVVYQGGEFSAAPDTARVGIGGVIYEHEQPTGFLGERIDRRVDGVFNRKRGRFYWLRPMRSSKSTGWNKSRNGFGRLAGIATRY